MEKSGYSKKRHDWSDDKRRKPYSLRPFKEYYEKDFILKYVPRGSKRDMEDGIDADIYEGDKITSIAIRDRPPMTAKGFNVCKASDVTIRTKKADGAPLEMYNTRAKHFIYNVINETDTDYCRSYQIKLQETREHFLKGDFQNKEIQNDDGNYFIPIEEHELIKYDLLIKKYPPPKKMETVDWM